ncbi:phosphatidylinositol kinase [Tersicoccus phoenicis]|uniref:Phosphatidylinositol kinase n=1 Tax=Tersicoccus phoenicis TaxID=554083 RepID=A0A1R1LBS6_9MICC|nr:SCO1664 family protein [Tersicoccus phoenicis]OMH24971.1 phosphatidylinositol kinase [Tersicoccus phoenicis]
MAGDERELGILDGGTIELLGQIARSSNETFLVEVADPADADEKSWAIYKPELGEKPLWDFEPGLYRRERAAYLLSAALGWDLVPATVVRDDAPFGIGSLQWFVECNLAEHYFTLMEGFPQTHDDLRRMAVFDVVTNNTDRKAGHVLRGTDGRIWGIDHGLCFSAPFKLRTVIWDFGGEPVDEGLLADIAPLAEEVPAEVAELLDAAEVRALRERVQSLLMRRMFPIDVTGRWFPWPLI